MTAQRLKYRLFRLRMMLLYPVGLSLMGYYAWVAPLFGRTHVERLRRVIPQRLSAAVLRLNRIGFSVEGLERLRTPESAGPRVLMSNHNSRFDAYILLAFYPRAYKSFWSNADHVTNEGFSLVHTFGRTFDMFFTHDKTNIRNTLREFKRAEEYLRAGGVVSFFPEGQFSADGWVRDIGSSCVGLAMRCSAPITPIVMLDTKQTFEDRPLQDGSSDARARVVILPQIETASLTKTMIPQTVQRIEDLMNNTVAAATNRARPADTPSASRCATENTLE